MQRIIKLTPETIKRIIAEEKSKLEKERKQKLFEHLKLLKKIKEKQIQSLKEVSDLHELKQQLVKKIKGDK